MSGRTFRGSRMVSVGAMAVALTGIGIAAPSIASADVPMSTFFCVYAQNGYTGDSICAQNYTIFTPFVIQSYFNDSRVPWCIEETTGHIIGVPSGGGVASNANIDAFLIAPCSQLA
jgi:hypothetical protein